MGSLGAMGAGSADRYFQKDVEDQVKLVPEGIEGQTPYRARSRRWSTSSSAAFARPWATSGRNIPDFQEHARFIRITGAGLRESHVHDVMITREARTITRLACEGRRSRKPKRVHAAPLSNLHDAWNEFQIRRNEIKTSRNKIKVRRNEIQIRRNEIQISLPSMNLAFSMVYR